MNKNPFDQLKKEETTPAVMPKSNIDPKLAEALHVAGFLLPEGAQIQIVPAGSKAIVYKTEISDELKKRVSDIENELRPLVTTPIKTQADVVNINATLGKAKKLSTAVDNERKLITSELEAEKKSLISLGRGVTEEIDKLIGLINTNITNFQIEEDRKAKELAAKIEKEKQEELKKIQDEQNRVAKIKQSIIDFESYALREIHSATIDDIDEKIKRINAVKLNPDHYQEFIGEAQIMHQGCVTKFNARKVELMQLAEAEKTNAAAAEKLRLEQEEKAKLEKERQQQKELDEKMKLEEQAQENVANVQMTSELKTSMIGKAKNIQKRWTFEEETIDMTLLPEEYKTFDAAKIKEAIAQGAREIPGVKIFEKIINTSR